jgi:allophanate hydrolase
VKLTIDALRTLYNSAEAKPSDVIAEVYDRIGRETQPVWISLIPREAALARARELENDPAAIKLPLYGIPFAIKDNIDFASVPTTAGCPAYAYVPERSATVVEKLLAAGAILVGKTNLDQFATGLVGARSPYGACSSVFDARYISGGSSSGSAVAVANELVSFSLGTDTAGSGRIPAAFNNLVGLKPSRGLLSAAGVVPACRSLDCVSIFAANCSDAQIVWGAAKGGDPRDPFTRTPKPGDAAAAWAGGSFRFGVPAPNQLEFFGDQESARLFANAVTRLEHLGGTPVEIDFSVFRAVAELLYAGPWVAERLAAIHAFFESHSAEMNPVVAGIIGGARRYSAVDAFEAEYRLRALRLDSEREWQRMDVLVVPSAPTIYTHEEIAADPVRLNTNLGYYTNFVAGGIPLRRSPLRHYVRWAGFYGRSAACTRGPLSSFSRRYRRTFRYVRFLPARMYRRGRCRRPPIWATVELATDAAARPAVESGENPGMLSTLCGLRYAAAEARSSPRRGVSGSWY